MKFSNVFLSLLSLTTLALAAPIQERALAARDGLDGVLDAVRPTELF